MRLFPPASCATDRSTATTRVQSVLVNLRALQKNYNVYITLRLRVLDYILYLFFCVFLRLYAFLRVFTRFYVFTTLALASTSATVVLV